MPTVEHNSVPVFHADYTCTSLADVSGRAGDAADLVPDANCVSTIRKFATRTRVEQRYREIIEEVLERERLEHVEAKTQDTSRDLTRL